MTGRPSDYDEEIATRLCLEIATRSVGLEAICREDDTLPCVRSVYTWLTKHVSFAQMYARAREQQAQLMADEIVAIADTTQMGETLIIKADGTERKVADMIEHRRLRIDSRKWVAAKLLPRKYGDRVGVEHTADDSQMNELLDAIKRS